MSSGGDTETIRVRVSTKRTQRDRATVRIGVAVVRLPTVTVELGGYTEKIHVGEAGSPEKALR
jgi:hypothetical protein